MKKLRVFALSVILAAAGLLGYCGSFYIKSWEENRQAKEEYRILLETCTDNTETANQKAEEKRKENTKEKTDQETDGSSERAVPNDQPKIKESFGISWEKLEQQNPDVVGWITVPGADISYPITQGEDDDYYLNHSFTGEKSPFGCIFLGCSHGSDFLDSHSFVYGHNIEGTMMFASLNRYESPEFYRKCPEFEIVTPERKFHYAVFSVEQAEEGGPSFACGYDLGSEDYRQQLQVLKENSLYETGVEVMEDRPTVTLITCNSTLDPTVRMAVHGICIQVENP